MLLTGAYPYGDPDGRQNIIMRKILQAQYVIPAKLKLSDSCKDLIRQIFTLNPTQRISIEGIKQHPWFTAPMPAAVEVCLLLLLLLLHLAECCLVTSAI